MSYAHPEALVGTEWLAANLGAPDLRLLDGSHHLPTAGRNARAEYDRAHIPGALFFDIDAIADPDTDLPHMLPSAEKFAEDVGRLGIGNGNKVVIYDAVGTTGAARVWWTFRVFGHRDVAVLDGGLPKWLAEGRPMTADVSHFPPQPYRAEKHPELVRDLEQIRRNIDSRREQLLDARSAGRFAAAEPEPRRGLRGGHVPGSLNLPSTRLFNEDRTFRSGEDLRRLFEEAGLDPGKPVATTCGSGVTAAVLALGLYLIGRTDAAVYDGSWSEWGARADTPVEP